MPTVGDGIKGQLSQYKGSFDMIVTGPLFPPSLPPSLRALDHQGKRVLVTGANAGIGKEMATYFAARGAEVYLLCRNEERAAKARDGIRAETGNKDVSVELVDMSSMKSVNAFLERWGKRSADEKQVDILFNNAGLTSSSKTTTSDGFEVTYQTNFLSQFMLTTSLIKQSAFSPDARIIQVASHALYAGGRPDPSDFNSANWLDKLVQGQEIPPLTSFQIYGRSKALQAAFTRELQERLDRTEKWKGVVVQSCHPGWVDTDIWHHPTGMGGTKLGHRAGSMITRVIGITSRQGVVVPIYLAVSPEAARLELRGKYWDRLNWRWPPGWMEDAQLKGALWRRWEEDSGVDASF